jgi:UDP-N-acetylmuramate dehydrogenase
MGGLKRSVYFIFSLDFSSLEPIMVSLEENVSLLPYNSFGLTARARYFCRVSTPEQLQELIRSPQRKSLPTLIVGEGSNILFTGDFNGLVIHMEIGGTEVVHESEERIALRVGAGEQWHAFVMHCVSHDWGGLENLSLIPGTVGAAPIQNIGAYGVEIKDCVEEVTGVDSSTGDVKHFTRDECRFEYRESVFKHALKGKIFVSSVTLSLTKKNHLFNTSYGAIQETLRQQNQGREAAPTVRGISDAVIRIRQSKLPDRSIAGSAGSFFKNPTLAIHQLEELKKGSPNIPFYHTVNQTVKVPAGWLIEQCGWKGKRFNNVGVYEHQALVLVNYGGGTGKEIFQLAMTIRDAVRTKFGVELETEVNIV